jgi:hypothetical protein
MRLRFTIRDLLWLAALIAVGLGWWIDHRRFGNYEFHKYSDESGRQSVELRDNSTGTNWKLIGDQWEQYYGV